MAYHWLLATCLIYMTSAIITPIQSRSNHLSNKLNHGTKHSFNRHSMLSRVPPRRLINRPRPQADIHAIAADILSIAADNHGDINPSTFFDDVEDAVRGELSAAALSFYDTLAPEVLEFVVAAVAFQALVDNEFDPDELDIDEIAQEIAEMLQDAYDNEEDCRPLLEDFDDFLSIYFGSERRRRLQDIVDGLLDFYNLVYDMLYWELTDAQREFLEMELDDGGFDSIVVGQGLLALFEADCVIDDASALQTVSSLLDVFMEFMDVFNGVADGEDEGESEEENDDEDDDDDDDESGESGDDAKSVNEVEDDLGLDIEQNEDGSETVTLEMATSTMTNMWIALIVFCGFNMSLFWFFMARKKKQSVHYETAEEVPSVSVHH